MKSLSLKKDIFWVGSLDPDLRIFDIIMHTEFGTTYNAYLVKGSKKNVLFETVKLKCFNEYLEKLKEVIDINDIHYLIMNHTEPDHAGSVEKLLDLNPNIKIVGSTAALKFLKAICNREFNAIPVSNGDTLSLGNKTLEFISAPYLHWPDSMFTYLKEDQAIFTCDAFGAHYCFDGIINEKVINQEDYLKALKYYYEMIMGPFKPYVLKAIDKIKDLDIEMIGTGHGPVLTHNPRKIIDIYKTWSTETNPNQQKTIIMPYVSAYGYTKAIADKITAGIKQTADIDVKMYDMVEADPDQVLAEIYWADGLLFGTPTINGEALKPIWDILINMYPIIHGKKTASAFGSYGWSGEGVPHIMERLKQLRMKVIEPGLKIQFNPGEKDLQAAFEFGINFANHIL